MYFLKGHLRIELNSSPNLLKLGEERAHCPPLLSRAWRGKAVACDRRTSGCPRLRPVLGGAQRTGRRSGPPRRPGLPELQRGFNGASYGANRLLSLLVTRAQVTRLHRGGQRCSPPGTPKRSTSLCAFRDPIQRPRVACAFEKPKPSSYVLLLVGTNGMV